MDLHRHAYYRGESIFLPVTVSDLSGKATLTASMDDLKVATASVDSASADSDTTTALRLPTGALKLGKYKLTVTLTGADGQSARVSDEVTIARQPNPDRLNIWLEIHGGFGDTWYGDHGFTTIGGPSWRNKDDSAKWLPDLWKRCDEALIKGEDIMLNPCGGLMPRDFKHMEPKGPEVFYKGANFVFHGINWSEPTPGPYYNPFNHEVAQAQDAVNLAFMRPIQDYPNVKAAFYNSEIVDRLQTYNRNPEGIAEAKRILGFTEDDIQSAPNYVAKGVVADDDKLYQYAKYVFTYGNGLSVANKRTADLLHSLRPDVQTYTDPYRSYTFYDTFPGIDIVGSWTYTNPDPKLMLFTETLRTQCKPTNQTPLNIITLLNYPGQIAPTSDYNLAHSNDGGEERGWMNMDTGRLKVTTWILLSRAPKIIGYYWENDPTNKDGTPKDTFAYPYSVMLTIKDLSNKVFKPYGPMIRNLDVTPRRIAVLSSESSRLYGQSPNLMGSWENNQIYHFYSVMAMDHLQADVVFDETIQRYGLNDYDVLVLPKCDVLLKSVYDKILEFRKRGGLVISDQYLGPDIPGTIKFPFDFTYRKKVTAQAIAKGQDISNLGAKDKPLEAGSLELEKATGVTALDDQKIMESYAAQLKTGLAGKVSYDVDCDSPTVLFNMLEKHGAKYLVVINDKRTYDDRVGKYKAVLGKLLPQTAVIKLHTWQYPELHAYDMLNKKALETKKTESGYELTVNLSEIGGTIIALYPHPLANLQVHAPVEMQRGVKSSLSVCVTDSAGNPLAGLQPVQVTVTDPKGDTTQYSDYYCAENGALTLPFVPAVNDVKGKWTVKATDLTAGKSATAGFTVE
jgi:hypothetical protein